MIDDNGDKRSLVLPKWREYNNAIKSKELLVPRQDKFEINQFTRDLIAKRKEDFYSYPSVYKASDLMGASIVVNDFETAREMAKYLFKKGNVELPTLNLCKKILNMKINDKFDIKTDEKISYYKNKIIKHPHDSICWMELARLYTIKGQIHKARKSVIVSVNLNPVNRYIVRSGARFFIHIGELDAALFYVKKALKSIRDPWIKALEVSIGHKLKKDFGKIRKHLPLDLPYEKIIHYSELFESCGMLELESGNIKNAKKDFRIAWKNPSESVIRHGEWVIRNKLQSLKSDSNLDYNNSNEALAWHYYYNYKPKESLERILAWELEEPYSSSPCVLGAYIETNLGRHDKAIKIAKRGLETNPTKFMLINNLCYALLRKNKIDEVQNCFRNVSPNKLKEEELLFYYATNGLYEFKKGNVSKGRELYMKCFEKCKIFKNNKLLMNAKLNLAIAEVESKTDISHQLAESALNASKLIDDPAIYYLRNTLTSIFKKS